MLAGVLRAPCINKHLSAENRLPSARKLHILKTFLYYSVPDRLIYYIFFPVMLFWKTGAPDPAGVLDWRLGVAVIAAILCAGILSLFYMKPTKLPDFAVGSFSQRGPVRPLQASRDNSPAIIGTQLIPVSSGISCLAPRPALL